MQRDAKTLFSLKALSTSGVQLFLAVTIGLVAGGFNNSIIINVANGVADVFVSLLKMVSLPIIFFSITSTASGMDSVDELKILGKRILKYTLLTTVLAATLALTLFIIINPAKTSLAATAAVAPEVDASSGGYFSYLLDAIPSNIIQPFATNNVIGVMFLAIAFSLAILAIPKENKETLHHISSSIYAAVMKLTAYIIKLMPFGICAFVTLFVHDVRGGLPVKSLALYLLCVVGANVIQATVILPILLKVKGLSPWRTFRGMWPALSVAFFSKSSSAALPAAMQCAEENLGMSRKTASFSLPLCTMINMNGCAAFILTTVLFVSMSNGVVFATHEMFLWIFIATIAALGNAGVPMGCYFLSSALLAGMNVPLHIMGIILPFYTLIDMLESGINVWSDCCVTAVVDKKTRTAEESVALA